MAKAVDQVDRDRQQPERIRPQFAVVARDQREAANREVEQRNAAQAVRAAEEGPVRRHRHGHHANRIGHQREHELAQPQGHQADHRRKDQRHRDRAGERDPRADASAGRQQRRGVAADGEEHGMREADFAEVGDDDVEAVGHHREDRDQHGGAVDRAAAAEQRRRREGQHGGQPHAHPRDRQNRSAGTRIAAHQCTPAVAPALKPPGRSTSTAISTMKAAAVVYAGDTSALNSAVNRPSATPAT